ncbi:TIGR00730 family Rossman fold protein [Corynebacterium sp. ES2794-CONJ1]|uniref:TIGR00730 family Rossman fold protein n=1 Tax=unclassified Corynebacterium TaxID=2624378 RepID=UPI0021697605|nr:MULTISPECIES: TIGR00730 family Rossman fold protein [unclassified Corynebacterium]MCS4492180.1 TIGR00730 family Rossman fold protein [Corynebacterium sp. ES2715-CONJ3]MCS4532339.1 TIGR00730 family Rossman fold protein [Corynebacterium sp. ES2730-CONJ]MCU9519698.1 TIGR00730 family Rossman fold protein [Corynebacterium sp. ES2794-CONJ1]
MTFAVAASPLDDLTVRIMTNGVDRDREDRTTAVINNLNRLSPGDSRPDISDPTITRYLDFDSQRGDIGVVLETQTGELAGVMWASFIKAWGFVADNVPEMVLFVDPKWQGHGIGGWFIDQAITHGRTHGWQGISVRVNPHSPARRLYARKEFIAQDMQGIMLRTLSPLIKSVAVYCGSVPGNRSEYADAARDLGRELAERGITMVYGGATVGLMGECANACLDAGGEVIGVIPKGLKDLEFAHPELTRLEITDDMVDRKSRMEELADAFIALPGGMGTLEELSEVLVRQQLGPYTGPVALFDVEDYWQPLIDALRMMGEEGFIWPRYLDAIVVADNVKELFEGFNTWANPGLKWQRGAAGESVQH